MAKRLVTIDTATGAVLSQWAGGDEQGLPPVAGRTHLALAEDDETDYGGHRWTGTAFVRRAAVAVIDPHTARLSRIETKIDQLLAKP